MIWDTAIYDWRPPPRRPPTCRRAGCNEPATVPDIATPEGDRGWCDQHLLLVRAARALAPPQAQGRRRSREWGYW